MDILKGKDWHVHEGDCITHMSELPTASMDFCVFSPPFPSLFSYTSEECDIGNSEDLDGEAKLHLSFFFNQLARIVKPGRVICVHCMQIPALRRNGEESTWDFRGTMIRIAKRAGLNYDGDWVITKNPQAQAIRTHSHKLLFVTLTRDRAVSMPAFVDYIIKFRVPGENATPISTSNEISREEWIEWAEGAWLWENIFESDTLNTAEAKGPEDTKHICPLQLEVYRRLILLYSNPGEIVFEPFGGVGSGGYMALGGKSLKTKKRIANPRRYYCCEIKPEYIAANKGNLKRAQKQAKQAEETLLPFGETA